MTPDEHADHYQDTLPYTQIDETGRAVSLYLSVDEYDDNGILEYPISFACSLFHCFDEGEEIRLPCTVMAGVHSKSLFVLPIRYEEFAGSRDYQTLYTELKNIERVCSRFPDVLDKEQTELKAQMFLRIQKICSTIAQSRSLNTMEQLVGMMASRMIGIQLVSSEYGENYLPGD